MTYSVTNGTMRLSEIDGARFRFTSWGCAFFASLRTQTRRKIRIRRARPVGVVLSPSHFPVFLPPLCVLFFLFLFFFVSLSRSCWRARSSVFRFGGETMKSLSPIAIANERRPKRPQPARARGCSFFRSFISRSI